MSSRVFLLFLFISLGSTIAAIDQTGLIIRITPNIIDIVKQAGVAFVGKLVNRTFQDIQVNQRLFKGTISSFKFRNLAVTPDRVSFTFQGASGILFEIKDLHFHVEYFDNVLLKNKKVSFHGHIRRAKAEMKLKREQGHLELHVPACEVTTDSITVDTAGLVGIVANTDLAKYIMKSVFNSQICGAITNHGVLALNKKLAEFTAVMKPRSDNDLTIDMSLSRDVAVTASSLDVPFKGVVSLVNQTAPDAPRGPDPVFTHDQTNHMVYVGVSQVFFNSATQALYRAGALSTTRQMCNVADFQVSVEGRALKFHPETVRCTVDNGSGIRDYLKNIFLTNKAKQYLSALFVPLPDGMDFTVADISYRDGFLVVGGSVFLGRDENERLVDLLFQPMRRMMFID